MSPPAVVFIASAAAATATAFVVYKFVWEPYVSAHFEAWLATFEEFDQAPRVRSVPIMAQVHPGYSSAVRGPPVSGDMRFRGEAPRTLRRDVEMLQLDVPDRFLDSQSPTPIARAPAYNPFNFAPTPSDRARSPSPPIRGAASPIRSPTSPIARSFVASPASPTSTTSSIHRDMISSTSSFSHVDHITSSSSPSSHRSPSISISEAGTISSLASWHEMSDDPFAEPTPAAPAATNNSNIVSESPSPARGQNLSVQSLSDNDSSEEEESSSDGEGSTGSWLSVNSRGIPPSQS